MPACMHRNNVRTRCRAGSGPVHAQIPPAQALKSSAIASSAAMPAARRTAAVLCICLPGSQGAFDVYTEGHWARAEADLTYE